MIGSPSIRLVSLLAVGGASLIGAAATPAPAQAPPAAAVDSLARAFMDEHGIPGLVIGFTSGEGDRVFPFGVASTTDGPPVDADTRFEVGSIAKVFTGLLLAEMVGRGEVDLDDPIGRHLPAGVRAPTYDGASITLRQLSTHTSGLPRLPSNLTPEDMADPYAGYTSDALHAFLHDHTLARQPGSAYEYSNLGAGLLGHLLARRAGSSFDALLHDRVVGPLGLTSTSVPVDPESDDAEDRLARGHSAVGPVPFWYFGALLGAGGLRSTAADLLRFLRAQLGPAGSPLADAIHLSQQTHGAGPQGFELALGWHVVGLPGDVRLFLHNGGTGGFRGHVSFAPGRELGIVVLANRDVDLGQFEQFAVRLALAALEATGGNGRSR